MLFVNCKNLALLATGPLLAAAINSNPCNDSGGQPRILSPQADTNLTEIAAANGGTFPFYYCGAANDFPNQVPGTKSVSIQVVFGVLPAGGFVGPIAAQFAHPTDRNRTYSGNLTIPNFLNFHTDYNFEILEVAADMNGKNPGIIRTFVNVVV